MNEDYLLGLSNKEIEKMAKNGGEIIANGLFQILFNSKKYVKACVTLPYINEEDRFEFSLMAYLNLGDTKKVTKLMNKLEVIGFNTAYLHLFSLILTRAKKEKIKQAFKVALVYDQEIAGAILDEIMLNKLSENAIGFVVNNEDIINKCRSTIKKYLDIYLQHSMKIRRINSYIESVDLYNMLYDIDLSMFEFIDLNEEIDTIDVEVFIRPILSLQGVKLTNANYIPPKEVRNIVMSTTNDEQELLYLENKKRFRASDYPLLLATFNALIASRNIEVVNGKINIINDKYDTSKINKIANIYSLLKHETMTLFVLLYIDDAIKREYDDIAISSIVELLYNNSKRLFGNFDLNVFECRNAFLNVIKIVEIMDGKILIDINNDRLKVVKKYATEIDILKSRNEMQTEAIIEVKYLINYPYETEMLNYSLAEQLKKICEIKGELVWKK